MLHTLIHLSQGLTMKIALLISFVILTTAISAQNMCSVNSLSMDVNAGVS